MAEADLLLLREQAALDDDLQELAPGGLPHGADVLLHRVPGAVLHHGDVDDHVDLIGAVFDGVLGLKGLGGGGHVAVGEADDRAEGEPIAHIALGAGDVAGRDADAGAVVLDGLVAELADLFRGAVHPQQGVVAFFQNFSYIHLKISFM